MNYLKQSLTQFKEKATELKEDYNRQHKNYGLPYAVKEEKLVTTHYVMITNNTQSTKILYDEATQIITVTNFYSSDLQTILELKEKLK